MTEVKCSVDSCYYWGKGNVCQANTITVKNDTDRTYEVGAGGRRNLEVGTLGAGAAASARTSSQTRCETFRPR